MGKKISQGLTTLMRVYDSLSVKLTSELVSIPCENDGTPMNDAYNGAITKVEVFLGTDKLNDNDVTVKPLLVSSGVIASIETGNIVRITEVVQSHGYADIPVEATISGSKIFIGTYRFKYVKQYKGSNGTGYSLNIIDGTRGIAYSAIGDKPEPSTSNAFAVELLENGISVTPTQFTWDCGGCFTTPATTNQSTFTPLVKANYVSESTFVSIKVVHKGNTISHVIPIVCTKHADGLDWIKDWDSQKPVVGNNFIVSPKIFAGSGSGTSLNGVALGVDPISGAKRHGIAGYKKGLPTFLIDTDGNFLLSPNGNNGSGAIVAGTSNGMYYDGTTLNITGKVSIKSGSTVGDRNVDIDTVVSNSDKVNTILVPGNEVLIDGGKISAGSITTNHIATDGISANKIKAGILQATTGKSYLNLNDGSMLLGETSGASYLHWNGSALDIKASSLKIGASSVATESFVQTTADNVTFKFSQSGGSNILKNGAAKAGTSFWYSRDYSLVGPDLTRSFSIRNDIWTNYVPGFELFIKNLTSGEYGFQQTFNTIVGKSYIFTCYLSGHSSEKSIVIRGNASSASGWLANKSYGHIHGGENLRDWTKVEIPFIAERAVTSVELNIVKVTNSTGGYLWAKELMISEGSVWRPFSPHPSEIYDGNTVIDSSGVTINNGALKINNKAGETVLKGNADGNLELKGGGMSITNVRGGLHDTVYFKGGGIAIETAWQDSPDRWSTSMASMNLNTNDVNRLDIWANAVSFRGINSEATVSSEHIVGSNSIRTSGSFHVLPYAGKRSLTCNGDPNNSISLASHGGDMWFRSSSEYFTFQIGTAADDWTKSFSIRGNNNATGGDNAHWIDIGQMKSNLYNGSYRGISVRSYRNGAATAGDVTARLYAINNNQYISDGSEGTVRFVTPSGWVDIGPKNSSYCHYATDGRRHHFAQGLSVAGNVELYSTGTNFIARNNYGYCTQDTSGSGRYLLYMDGYNRTVLGYANERHIMCYGHFLPMDNKAYWLGTNSPANQWKGLCAEGGTVGTSDARAKENIVRLDGTIVSVDKKNGELKELRTMSSFDKASSSDYYKFMRDRFKPAYYNYKPSTLKNEKELSKDVLDRIEKEGYEPLPQVEIKDEYKLLKNVGFIAQDYDLENDKVAQEFIFEGEEGNLSYNHMSYVTVGMVALQETINKLEDLSMENKKLKDRLLTIESKLT